MKRGARFYRLPQYALARKGFRKFMSETEKFEWQDAEKQPRGWYIEVAEAQRESEERFLKSEIYGRDLSLKSIRLNAYNRYSDRL